MLGAGGIWVGGGWRGFRKGNRALLERAARGGGGGGGGLVAQSFLRNFNNRLGELTVLAGAKKLDETR